MQKAELLYQAIAAAAAATGMAVDSDRPSPANASELPLVIVRRGALRAEPKTPQTWARNWIYSPVVEIWASHNDQDANRIALNSALEAFVDAFYTAIEQNRRSVEDEPLLTPGTSPELFVAPVNVVNDTRIRGYAIEIELSFER